MTAELQAAIANAYRVFARYDLRGGVTVCRCNVCVDAETERQLNTVPLGEMSSRLLAQYTSSAHSWDGKTENDFRHYLPRYFELIAQGDAPSDLDEAHCLIRLAEADHRRNWDLSEAGAVDRFFLALLRERLASPLEIDPMHWAGFGSDPVETTLCTVANAGCDLTDLLAAWQADTSRDATLHLAAVVCAANLPARLLRSSWWLGDSRPHPEIGMKQVVGWLLRPRIRERLEAAVLAEQDESAAAMLSHAEGVIGGMV